MTTTQLSKASDEQLMQLHSDGLSGAFEELFRRYASDIDRMMQRGLWRRDDAADLVQEAFLNLHRSCESFEQGRSLRPWLYSIAMNVKRNYIRRRKVRPESPQIMDDYESNVSSAGDPAERRSTARAVRSAVNRLPHGQREVVKKHWFEEMSFEAVSQGMDVGLSAVKVRAHRSYGSLRVALANL